MTARRVISVAIAWVLVLAFARQVVALPERCPDVSVAAARSAAGEAVGWFERNQLPDGRWTYRYDREQDQADLRPHSVRHSGVTLSLYQAHAAGIDGALAVADRGVAWSLGELVRAERWTAVRAGPVAPTGATALLVSALSVRRLDTGDGRYDEAMNSLGRFLVAMTEPSGAVVANWDVLARRPVAGDYSPYFTGEAYLALALLATADPSPDRGRPDRGPWAQTARRIGAYLATERDRAEHRFPPTSDHWAAYGLAQLGLGDAPDAGLGPAERAYAERLAALFSVQVRFESQRTGSGADQTLLRGPQASGAGLGTLGEGLGSLWRLAGAGPVLADERPVIGERVRCVAGMLVDRQVDDDEATEAGRPGLARGAWFQASGVTQMDDQQHALSALLLARPALAADGTQGRSTGDDATGRIVWLAVVALAVAGPARTRRNLAGAGTRPVAVGVAVTIAVLAVLAAVADPLLRGISITPPTALIAAGVVAAATAAADLIRPGPTEPGAGEGRGAGDVVATVLRPGVALVVLAVAGDIGAGAGIAAAVAGGAAGLVALMPPGGRAGWAGRAGRIGRLVGSDAVLWAGAAVALLGAVDLAVDGVLAI